MPSPECNNCPSNLEVQRQVLTLVEAVAELSKTVNDLRVETKGLATQIKYTTCPNPGACVSLAKDHEQLAEVVRGLKQAHDQRTGERAVLVVIGSFVGAILSGIITFIATNRG